MKTWGSQKANPKLKPPTRTGQGEQPQMTRGRTRGLKGRADSLPHEGRSGESLLRGHSDVPSLAITGPVSLQLDNKQGHHFVAPHDEKSDNQSESGHLHSSRPLHWGFSTIILVGALKPSQDERILGSQIRTPPSLK
jgi:hypothetical protein